MDSKKVILNAKEYQRERFLMHIERYKSKEYTEEDLLFVLNTVKKDMCKLIKEYEQKNGSN